MNNEAKTKTAYKHLTKGWAPWGLGDDSTGHISLGRVFNVEVQGGDVVFEEGCDNWFNVSLSKKEAIEMLNEVISYIEEN